ncbi:MAG TPA: hypothetical protein VHR84_04020 [Terriglobales bacterium]|jgi:hypothetical protein|nr:hypothetical protein [Terriglobales bacterium]
MIDLIRKSEVPSNLMHAAARGALSVPPAEMIEILVHLAKHNHTFGPEARLTLAGWDEQASKAAASDPTTSREVLEYLCSLNNLRPVLLPSLLDNLSVGEDLLLVLAKDGNREVVEALLGAQRIRSFQNVADALLSNPHLTEAESLSLKDPQSAAASPTPSSADESGETEAKTYLNDHAAEIAAEGHKPFQPIGGIQDELESAGGVRAATPSPVSTPQEHTTPPIAVAAAPSASGAAAAAPKAVTTHKVQHPHHDEKRDSTLQKIAKLDVKGRIQLAIKGTKEERSLLIRDGTKLVAMAVLESPKVSDGEVEKFASQKNVLEAVLRAISMKRRYAKQYTIVRNLVFNPRTPLDVSLGLVKNLLVNDLKNLSGNKEVSETVRKLGLRMFKQKVESSGKRN